ncbi:MAG: TIGR00366 family protein [Gemmatimonadota bacterium]|jgi:uncharacterized ion transporter superfamily protein YfcC
MSDKEHPRALDTSLIIFGMIVLAAILTWIVPAGAFLKNTIEVPGAGMREVVVPGSFEFLAQSEPQGLGAVLLAPIRGLVAAADIVAFVLIVGGAFSVLQATGAVDAGLRRLVSAAERSHHVDRLVIPIFMVLFSLGGAIFGMAEETIPFVLIFVPLARSLGYDAVVGVAIPFVGSQAGFAAAFLNPFTIGVAQGIADVPLFSGIGLRVVMWFITTSLAIAFVMWYAARVKREGGRSVVADLEAEARRAGDAGGSRDAGASDPGAAPGTPARRAPDAGLTGRDKAVLLTFAAGIVLLVVGVIRWGWYIEEIAALFVGLGIALGVVGRMRPGEVSGAFMDGARALVATAVIIGLARGILIVLEDGQVIDTLLHAMASVVDDVGHTGSAEVMFAVQTALNFFVPSGSGQAALTMPIMAPLADLVGVTRQVAVLAYQLGDGFTNMIIPTNPVLIGAISLGGVPWERWAKWMLPLQVVFFGLGLVALAIAVAIGYGFA